MNAAFTSYEESGGPGIGVHERLCGTTGTTGTPPDEYACSRSQ